MIKPASKFLNGHIQVTRKTKAKHPLSESPHGPVVIVALEPTSDPLIHCDHFVMEFQLED